METEAERRIKERLMGQIKKHLQLAKDGKSVCVDSSKLLATLGANLRDKYYRQAFMWDPIWEIEQLIKVMSGGC